MFRRELIRINCNSNVEIVLERKQLIEMPNRIIIKAFVILKAAYNSGIMSVPNDMH